MQTNLEASTHVGAHTHGHTLTHSHTHMHTHTNKVVESHFSYIPLKGAIWGVRHLGLGRLQKDRSGHCGIELSTLSTGIRTP